MPHKSDSNRHKGATLSLSSPVCLSTRTVLFFLVSTLLVSLLSVFVGILFCKADGPGLCHQPLVPGGLVARIQCSHCHCPTSIYGRKPKPYFKPLQAEATRDQYEWPFLRKSYKLNLWCLPQFNAFCTMSTQTFSVLRSYIGSFLSFQFSPAHSFPLLFLQWGFGLRWSRQFKKNLRRALCVCSH